MKNLSKQPRIKNKDPIELRKCYQHLNLSNNWLSLINYVHHAPSRLRAIRAPRVFVPQVHYLCTLSKCLVCVLYAPYVPYFCVLRSF